MPVNKTEKLEIMKRLLLTSFVIFTVFGCFGQRFEVWVKTSNSVNAMKGNYGFSNDSVLMTFTNSSLFIPAKNQYFSWDDVTNLKIRNKSKNQLGQLIGASAGTLASIMVYNSLKNSTGEEGIAVLSMFFAVPICIGGGTLIGHLATNKKTEILMNGIDSKDKNILLEGTLNNKKK